MTSNWEAGRLVKRGRWPLAAVVCITEKAERRLRHVCFRDTITSEPLKRSRNRSTAEIKTGVPPICRKEFGGNLITGHAESGVKVA